MATIITGRKLTISIGATDYSAQAGAVSLVPTNNTEVFQTLAGPDQQHPLPGRGRGLHQA